MFGLLSPFLDGASLTVLGYRNEGCTLDTPGMLMVNGCTWAHVVQAVGRLTEVPQDWMLSSKDRAAINGECSPQGILIPSPGGKP